MYAQSEHFSLIYFTVRILEVAAALAQRFHLRTEKLNSSLVGFDHKVIVTGLSVICNYP